MATHSVNVIVKARDEASKKFGRVGQSAGSLTTSFKKLAVTAGAYFGTREIKRFLSGSLELFGKQDRAVRGLSDALGLLGKGGSDVMADMQQFASSIQKITTHGDEAVLEVMKLGASIGQLSGDNLQQATIAAIGLSKAFGMDLTASMRLVARAAVGDTATLTRYGIKLDQGLSAQEKFNRVLQIGTKNFKLAEGETKTYNGSIEQMKNALGDLREEIGRALAPTVIKYANILKDLNIETVKSIGRFVKWTAAISAGIYLGPKIVGAISGIVKAIKGLTSAQTIAQALAGPAGWVSLGTGLIIAAGTLAVIDEAFSGLSDDMAVTQQEMIGVNAGVNNITNSARELNNTLQTTQKTLNEIVTPLQKVIALSKTVFSLTSQGMAYNLFNKLTGTEDKENLGENTKTARSKNPLYYTPPGAINVKSATSAVNAVEKLGSKWAEVWRKWQESIKSAAEANAPWKKVHDDIGRLKQSVSDFGKTEEELLLKRMKESGHQEPGMAMVRKDFKQLEYLEDRKSRTEALAETTKDLNREIALYGKDEFEAKLFDLKELGATEYQLRDIKSAMDELRKLKKGEKTEKPDYEFKQSLDVKEARFLTFAPGAKFNNTERYAKSTQRGVGQTVKVLTRIEKILDRRDDRGGSNLRTANFS